MELHEINTHAFKCEVCKNKIESKEELDINLTTCEVNEYCFCDFMHMHKRSELKTHWNNKHTGNVSILHVKMSREGYVQQVLQ